MIASWVDYIPLPLLVALLVVVGVVLVIGIIYVLMWEADVVIGGTLDSLRDLRNRFIERRVRRRLRP